MPPESLTDWSQTSPTTPRHGATEPVALSVATSPAAPATTRAAATTVRASAQQRELTVQWLTVAQQQAQARAAAEAAARAAAAKAAAMRASQQRGPTPSPYHPDSSAPPATPATGGGGSGTFQQLAVCEEGGSNSATFGYYGILPSTWNGHDGVATAGEDSMANQQAFALSINGGRVPYAPVGCGNAGYHGW